MAKVNEQILDAIIVTNEIVLSDVVAESYSVVAESFAHSLSLVMINHGTEQFAGSQTANAAVVGACAAIISAAKSTSAD